MKRNLKFILVALVGFSLASCNMFNPPTEYKLSDLQGLWQNDKYATWHVRFTNEAADEKNYYWGCEWGDFGDDVKEEDLVFHGNGWFKYSFISAELIEIHKMDEDWAEEPKIYIVTKLTDTELNYYDKKDKNSKFIFSKVVEAK